MCPFSKILFFILAFFSGMAFAFPQTATNQVIGSAGSHKTAGNFMVSYTVGETVVQTREKGKFILTQGFHQPSSLAGGTLIIRIAKKDANCLTAKNGEALATVLNGTPPYQYSWSPEGGNSTLATGLGPGVYFLLVKDALDREGLDTITIGALADDACEIHVYHGITPNGDGNNDEWHIDGITIFPDNSLSIYNRWGELMWGVKGYNNDDKVFKGKDFTGDKLPDGTYFYVLEIEGLETDKGWLQITR